MSENVQDNNVPFDLDVDGTNASQENNNEFMEEMDNNTHQESAESVPAPVEVREPASNAPQNVAPQSQNKTNYNSNSSSARNDHNGNNSKGDDFRKTVAEYSVSMYRYAARIKKMGHSSVADLMFKDLMTIIMATNTASDAIGREKFMEFLEDGYYASSRMMEYMKFLSYNGVLEEMYEPLMEDSTRIHKVFGASLKTTRSKKQPAYSGM